MGFAAKLRDVEQQLSRVAGVVQLHVQLGASYGGSVGQESGVSELVESVERARGELNAATEQLLALARRSVDPSGEDGDTETEDEFEENARVKSEIVDLPDDKEVTSTVFDAVASDAQEATMEVGTTGVEAVDCGDVEEENGTTTLHDSSLGEQVVVQPGEQHSWDILASNFGFILYASFAERVKKKAKLGFLDADAALSCMSSRDIETWRQYVREYIACVHGKFLAYLRNGKVAREPVVLFSDATLLAVTLLTTRDKCRDRYWLLERAEELNDILHAAKIPPVVQMLRLVEKSHTDLVSYYISNFDDALEDMSEYVELVERHCMAEKKPMLPFLISLLRKFICDCVDYKLRQEVAIGMPRTEAQWARFHEIGVTLASWINAVATADIPHEMISRAINTERLRQFRDQFPGRIPEALLVAWRRVSSAKQEVAASKRGIELANVSGTRGGGAEIAIKHHSTDLPYTIPAPPFVWGPTRQFAKKRRSPCLKDDTDSNKHVVPAQKKQRTTETDSCRGPAHVGSQDLDPVSGGDLNSSEATDVTNKTTQSLPKTATPLERYLSAAKEAEESIKTVVKYQAAKEDSAARDVVLSDTKVVGKWTTAVKQLLNAAINEFTAKIARGSVDAEMEAAFAEATVLAVSLITTSENNKNFKRPWVLQIVESLDDINEKKEQQNRCTAAFLSILESRNALLVHCDSRFPDYLVDTTNFVNKVEEAAKEDVGMDRLQEIVKMLSLQFGRVCRFCMWRHQVSCIKAWTDEQWQSFVRASWFLTSWTEIMLQASLPPPTWLHSLRETLEKFDTQFPRMLPQALLQLRLRFEEGAVTAGSSPRQIVTKIQRIKLSDMPGVIATATRWKTTKYLEKVTQVQHRLDESESDSVAASTLQHLLIKGHETNEQFLKYISRGNSDLVTNFTFGHATGTLGSLICRSPRGLLSPVSLKDMLCDYDNIIAASSERQDSLQFVMPLTETYLRIQKVVNSDKCQQ